MKKSKELLTQQNSRKHFYSGTKATMVCGVGCQRIVCKTAVIVKGNTEHQHKCHAKYIIRQGIENQSVTVSVRWLFL